MITLIRVMVVVGFTLVSFNVVARHRGGTSRVLSGVVTAKERESACADYSGNTLMRQAPV
jgi:hypothetical protein